MKKFIVGFVVLGLVSVAWAESLSVKYFTQDNATATKTIMTPSAATKHFNVYGVVLNDNGTSGQLHLRCGTDNNTVLLHVKATAAGTVYDSKYAGHYVRCADNATINMTTSAMGATEGVIFYIETKGN